MFVGYPTQNAAMATHDMLDVCFKTMSRPYQKGSGLLAGGRALGFPADEKDPELSIVVRTLCGGQRRTTYYHCNRMQVGEK